VCGLVRQSSSRELYDWCWLMFRRPRPCFRDCEELGASRFSTEYFDAGAQGVSRHYPLVESRHTEICFEVTNGEPFDGKPFYFL